MFGGYVIIGLIGIILIAYLGLFIPIAATTGYHVQVPLVSLSETETETGPSITVEPVGSGEGVPVFGIISAECSEFKLQEPLELEIEDKVTAFNILKVFVPLCEAAETENCLEPETTVEGAESLGVFSFKEINVDGESSDAWVIGNTWSLDSEGNLYSCSRFGAPPETPSEPAMDEGNTSMGNESGSMENESI